LEMVVRLTPQEASKIVAKRIAVIFLFTRVALDLQQDRKLSYDTDISLNDKFKQKHHMSLLFNNK